MTGEGYRIPVDVTFTTTGDGKAQEAVTLTTRGMDRMTPASESVASGITKVGQSSGNASRSLLLFSQGFEDAQYGIRGVLNNIPGLVLSLGGTAGLAGAISIAAVSFSVLYEWLGKTETKAADLTKIIEVDAEKISSALLKMGDDIYEAKQDAIEWTAEINKKLTEGKKAQDEAATSAISNAEKVAEAQQLVNAARGIQVDRMTEIQRMAALEEEKLATKARIEQEAADIALQAEVNQAMLAVNRRTAAAQEIRDLKEKLDLAKQALKVLQDEEQAAKGKVSEGRTGIDRFLNNWDPTLLAESKQAQQKLDNQGFQDMLQVQKNIVEGLQRKIEDLAGERGELQKLDQVADQAQKLLLDQQTARDERVATIQAALEVDSGLADAKKVTELQKAAGEKLKTVIADLNPQTADQAAAVEALTRIASDGKVIETERAEMVANLSKVISGLQSGTEMTSKNVAELIGVASGLIQSQSSLAGEIRNLKSRTDALSSQVEALRLLKR